MTNYLIFKQNQVDEHDWRWVGDQEATSTEIAIRKQLATMPHVDGTGPDGTYVAVADSGWRPYRIGTVVKEQLQLRSIQ